MDLLACSPRWFVAGALIIGLSSGCTRGNPAFDDAGGSESEGSLTSESGSASDPTGVTTHSSGSADSADSADSLDSASDDASSSVGEDSTGGITTATSDVTGDDATSLATTGVFGECGDRVVDDNEECDPPELPNGGHCTGQCKFDKCGDGYFGKNELCDDQASAPKACGEFLDGTIGEAWCSGCEWQLGECTLCGNGVKDAEEACDTNFDEMQCGNGNNMFSGTGFVSCGANCQFHVEGECCLLPGVKCDVDNDACCDGFVCEQGTCIQGG